jgi:ABC-type amino acid transport substrate-binding protein
MTLQIRSLFVFSLFFIGLVATEVVFIKHPILAVEDSENDFSRFFMKKIFERLDLDFIYQYVEHIVAMQKIDDEENVVIFPYTPPRIMSVRINLSDTLYTQTQHVWYDVRRFPDKSISRLSDLNPRIVGSSGSYPHERWMRREGLTIHYSRSNQISLQKLIEGRVDFVVEDKIKMKEYFTAFDYTDIEFICFFENEFFPEYHFAISAVANSEATSVIDMINGLIAEGDFLRSIIYQFLSE